MTKRRSQRKRASEGDRAEHFSENRAVRELLDHLAEELAREYVGLMKETASKPEDKEE